MEGEHEVHNFKGQEADEAVVCSQELLSWSCT